MKCECIFDSEFCHQLNTIKNEEMSWKIQPKNMIIFNLRIGHLNKRFIVTDISRSLLD